MIQGKKHYSEQVSLFAPWISNHQEADFGVVADCWSQK